MAAPGLSPAADGYERWERNDASTAEKATLEHRRPSGESLGGKLGI